MRWPSGCGSALTDGMTAKTTRTDMLVRAAGTLALLQVVSKANALAFGSQCMTFKIDELLRQGRGALPPFAVAFAIFALVGLGGSLLAIPLVRALAWAAFGIPFSRNLVHQQNTKLSAGQHPMDRCPWDLAEV